MNLLASVLHRVKVGGGGGGTGAPHGARETSPKAPFFFFFFFYLCITLNETSIMPLKINFFLTPCSIDLEKLMVAHLVMKFPIFYRTQIFTIMFSKSPPLDSILSQMYPILPSLVRSLSWSKWSLPFRFSDQEHFLISPLHTVLPTNSFLRYLY